MSHLFALINCGTQCEDSALLILLSTVCEDLECRKALEDKGRAFESTLLQALLLIFLSNMKNILLSPTRCFFFLQLLLLLLFSCQTIIIYFCIYNIMFLLAALFFHTVLSPRTEQCVCRVTLMVTR